MQTARGAPERQRCEPVGNRRKERTNPPDPKPDVMGYDKQQPEEDRQALTSELVADDQMHRMPALESRRDV
jgi:hypothetical protein